MPEIKNREPRLKDKVAIVTGGGLGIGRAFCLGMADEGAKVVVVGNSNMNTAEATVKGIEAKGGEAIAVKADVSLPEDTLEMAKKTVERFGRIDILINNAAISSMGKITYGNFMDLDLSEWDRVMAVNLKGPFLCIRAVFPYMKEQGGGKIINIGSGAFFLGQGFTPHYVASKGGVIGLTRSLSTALGQYNIKVNCLTPGKTLTYPEIKEELEVCEFKADRRSLKRVEYAEDLVGAAIFFASSDSDFITGQTLVVDGGEVKY